MSKTDIDLRGAFPTVFHTEEHVNAKERMEYPIPE